MISVSLNSVEIPLLYQWAGKAKFADFGLPGILVLWRPFRALFGPSDDTYPCSIFDGQ
jgi:hypothetical protein